MGVRIIQGDCRDVLKSLPDESVHCVVTSPPYWGLRDYGTAKWEGGEEGCDHIKGEMRRGINLANSEHSTRGGAKKIAEVSDIPFGNVCGKCGAHRIDSQLGLEPTIEAYVETMVAVFREVRRVLRKDGTLWLNLGDSYAASRSYQVTDNKNPAVGPTRHMARAVPPDGLKQKDLCGIPWRVVFALQADGWYLRQDIIWSKPNPMPESVTDRPTKAHEYLFLLSKSANYFYDAEAIKEASEYPDHDRKSRSAITDKRMPTELIAGVRPGSQTYPTRNRRSVWEIATSPFPEAHFATFPPALVEPCIKAGTSEKGCCAKCGAPWVREVEKSGGTTGKSWHDHEDDLRHGQSGGIGYNAARGWENDYRVQTLGWSPSCGCWQEHTKGAIPACTILDPFGGAGTTGMVADRLGRDAILIELSPSYAAMAERRIKGDAGLFAAVENRIAAE